jgi:hypothetical protein
VKKLAVVALILVVAVLLALIWQSGAGRRSIDHALSKLRYDGAVAAVDRLYEQTSGSVVTPAELAVGSGEIRRAEEGVYVPTHRRFVEEDGLFILRRGTTFRPEEQGDPRFERVWDRLYRYHVSG